MKNETHVKILRIGALATGTYIIAQSFIGWLYFIPWFRIEKSAYYTTTFMKKWGLAATCHTVIYILLGISLLAGAHIIIKDKDRKIGFFLIGIPSLASLMLTVRSIYKVIYMIFTVIPKEHLSVTRIPFLGVVLCKNWYMIILTFVWGVLFGYNEVVRHKHGESWVSVK